MTENGFVFGGVGTPGAWAKRWEPRHGFPARIRCRLLDHRWTLSVRIEGSGSKSLVRTCVRCYTADTLTFYRLDGPNGGPGTRFFPKDRVLDAELGFQQGGVL